MPRHPAQQHFGVVVVAVLVDHHHTGGQRRRLERGQRRGVNLIPGSSDARFLAIIGVVHQLHRAVRSAHSASHFHPPRLEHPGKSPGRKMRRVVDPDPVTPFASVGSDFAVEPVGAGIDRVFKHQPPLPPGRDRDRAVLNRDIGWHHEQRRFAQWSGGGPDRQFVAIEAQCGHRGSVVGTEIVPAHPRAPALVGKPGGIADHSADHFGFRRHRIGKRRQAIDLAVRCGRHPRIAAPDQHHIGHALALARCQQHPRAALKIWLIHPRQQSIGRGGGEHLGVGGRNEALVRIDRDHLRPGIINHQQSKPGALGSLGQLGLNHLLLRNGRRCLGRSRGCKQQGERGEVSQHRAMLPKALAQVHYLDRGQAHGAGLLGPVARVEHPAIGAQFGDFGQIDVSKKPLRRVHFA